MVTVKEHNIYHSRMYFPAFTQMKTCRKNYIHI